jgi:hypothetical protein
LGRRITEAARANLCGRWALCWDPCHRAARRPDQHLVILTSPRRLSLHCAPNIRQLCREVKNPHRCPPTQNRPNYVGLGRAGRHPVSFNIANIASAVRCVKDSECCLSWSARRQFLLSHSAAHLSPMRSLAFSISSLAQDPHTSQHLYNRRPCMRQRLGTRWLLQADTTRFVRM